MLRGLRIDVEGVLSSVEIDDTTTTLRLDGMNAAIGCNSFDVVSYTDTVDVWVDDEGLYRSTLNRELSVMLRARQPDGQGAWFGAGLFLGIDQATGDSRSLTDDERAAVVRDWTRQRGPSEYAFAAQWVGPVRTR
ncbi:DUF3846 domain-containing protein [Schumannella soli]|uniref:DUF3846 domain-containing protein n=1 Tax=Schumannella soli TaxID=2590779 RepID=A0A506XZ61_9MICO|nr:DUF3846 domain-containing protein [Schumannella soli]TPW78061.1 DUF3846 domain-containing protein [Schumannella soli]